MNKEQIHILLVEDDPGDADLLQEILSEKSKPSFIVTEVDRLQAGLERLGQEAIDVILLDLSLPDSQGLETFTTIYAQAPNVPLVVLSGLDDESVAMKAVQAGAQDYLIKGEVDRNLLVRALRYAIERKRTENALRQAREELERRVAERTAELRQANADLEAFAHTVAHNLQNPLSIIVGYTNMLQLDYTILTTGEILDHLDLIARNGHKMADIIKELLLLAGVRKMEVDIRPLDMAPIVAEAQQRLTHIIKERQARISLPTASAWPVSVGYAPWIEEVWVNYLSNALKYGGQPPNVELGGTKQINGMVRYWIRDNGPGISLEEQARLFKPFTQLGSIRAKGHGLGLFIVQSIVEKLDGQVGIESKIGQGSTFSFTLPGINKYIKPGNGNRENNSGSILD